MNLRTIGGKIVTVTVNTELVTWQSCGISTPCYVSTACFYVKNEDVKDIYVKINGGSDVLLKPGELLDLSGLTKVNSCIVCTDNSRVRWGGLI